MGEVPHVFRSTWCIVDCPAIVNTWCDVAMFAKESVALVIAAGGVAISMPLDNAAVKMLALVIVLVLGHDNRLERPPVTVLVPGD